MKNYLKWMLPIFALLLLSACSGEGVKGNGQPTSQARQLQNFEKIVINGRYNVMITAGKNQRLTVTADSNFLPLIQTVVKDNELVISNKDNEMLVSKNAPAINIRVPKLTSISTNGNIKLQAGEIKANDFKLKTTGASNVKLSGKVSEVDVKSFGASVVNALGLTAQSANINVEGASTVKVNAPKLEIKINGAGQVDYVGNPTITQQVKGIGKIQKIQE